MASSKSPFRAGRTLDALYENMEILTGQRGDGRYRATTTQEVARLSQTVTSRLVASGSNSTHTTVQYPHAPQNVQALGGFAAILVQWDAPTFKGFAHAEVWRAASNVFGEAVLMATTPATVFSDVVSTGARFYYWVRFVNQKNLAGPYHGVSGIQAQTSQNIRAVIDELAEQLRQSELIAELETTLGHHQSELALLKQLDTDHAHNQATFESLIVTVKEANKVWAAQIEQLHAASQARDEAQAAATSATLTQLQTVLAQADQSIAQRVDSVEAKANAAGQTGQEAKAAAQTNAQAIATLNQDGSAAYRALWSAKVEAGQITAGIGLIARSDGTSQVAVNASQFFVYDANQPGKLVPTFAIDEGEVVIPKALIEKATIQILQAQTIVADEVRVGIDLVAPLITAGEYRGGDAGFGFGGPYNDYDTFIHANGLVQTNNLQAEGGYFSGLVKGANVIGGEITGATIIGATIITSAEYYWVEGSLLYGDGNEVLAAPYAVGVSGNYNLASYDFRAWKTTNRLRWATLAAGTLRFGSVSHGETAYYSSYVTTLDFYLVLTYVNAAGVTTTAACPNYRVKSNAAPLNITLAGVSFKATVGHSVTTSSYTGSSSSTYYSHSTWVSFSNNLTAFVGLLLTKITVYSKKAGASAYTATVSSQAYEVNNAKAKPQ